LHLPLQQLAPGRKTKLIGGYEGTKGVPFPAAIAVLPAVGGNGERLLVANNLSDDVLLLDAANGAILKRFDLAESNAVPSTYPVALAVTKDGTRAFVALWNASEIVEIYLSTQTIGRKLPLLKPSNPIAAGTHPCALQFSPDATTLYVALANRDAVAAVNVEGSAFAVKGYFDTRLPHQSYFGAEPEALAISADGKRLYVANAITDAIAVIDPRKLTDKAAAKGMVEPIGFVPTEWMPMSMAFLPSASGGNLYVATAKGHGTTANGAPMKPTEPGQRFIRPYTYICTLLHGSIATLDAKQIDRNLRSFTNVVLESNRMKAAQEKIAFAGTTDSRIKHVIYIIKENRTYDQVFGDLKQDGKPVAMATPSSPCTAHRSRPTCTSSRFNSACSIISTILAKSPAKATSGPTPPSAPTISRKPGSSPIAAASAVTTTKASSPKVFRSNRTFRCQRAGKRLSVGKPRRAQQDLLSFRRIHREHVLQ